MKIGRTTLRDRAKAVRVLDLIKSCVSDNSTALSSIRDSKADPFKILISTILSARTRDPVTEKASDRLFERYKDANALSEASASDVETLIKPVNFYRSKATRIIQVSKMILEKYLGEVPNSYEELMELPGVGRKTAGCVLVYGFSKPAIPVDVHVHRISNRIGLTNTRDPEETEEKLLELYDKRHWVSLNEVFVSFGQTVCLPTRPRCEICPVRRMCKYYPTNRVSTS